MKLRWFIFIVILPIVVYLFIIYGHGSSVPVGEKAPDFSLPAVDGGKLVKLSDYRGSVVLLHFWASWCDQCVYEFPSLIKLSNLLRGKDFVILALNEDDVHRQAGGLPDFSETGFRTLIDMDGHVADAYGVYSIPKTYILDKDGNIIDLLDGAVQWDSEKYIKKMQDLAEK